LNIFPNLFLCYNIELDCWFLSLLLMHYMHETSQIERTLFNFFIKHNCLCLEFTHKH
jgi:hypothetical protein